MTDTSAEAVIEGDDLVIRLPMANIQAAVLGGWGQGNLGPLFIDHPRSFAQAMCHALNYENEVGDTMVHKLLDDAITTAFEHGTGMDVGEPTMDFLYEKFSEGTLPSAMTTIERMACELYEASRKNVSGRPAWADLNPDDPYDMGMRRRAFDEALVELGLT
jgi:hypothetical protein